MAEGPVVSERSQIRGVDFKGVGWYDLRSPRVEITHLPQGKTEFTASSQKTVLYLKDHNDAQEFLRLVEKNPYLVTQLTGKSGSKAVAIAMETRVDYSKNARFTLDQAEKNRFENIAKMNAFRGDGTISALAAKATGKTVPGIIEPALTGQKRGEQIRKATGI